MGARLKDRYLKEIVPRLRERLQLKNVMEVPRVEKVVVNMGVGDARDDQKFMESAVEELTAITGQRPQVTRSRVSISGFKLRAGQQVGCMVTLRGERMYEFLDRLINVAVPRIRDFRGLSPDSFDHVGNYNLGLREQLVFPEVNFDKMARVRGMNITIVIKNGEESGRSLELLKEFGMPFRQQQQR